MPVKLNSTGGGSVTLTTPSTGSDFTVTIPAATGTMVTTTSASTIEFAAGTVSAPSITTTGDTNTGIYFPAADTIAFTEGGVESMRIDSSGNVGIGTSSPSSWSTLAALGSNGTGFAGITAINSNGNVGIGGIQFASDTTYTKAAIGLLRSDPNGKGSLVFYNDSNSDAANWSTGDEKMRIDTSGNLLVGLSASAAIGGRLSAAISGNNAGTFICDSANFPLVAWARGSGGGLVYFAYGSGGSNVGTITTNGTTTSYNTTSDYRLKHDVKPMVSGLSAIVALKPSTYKWNVDSSYGEGFIAHELAEVIPLAVSGEKDAINEDGSIKPQGVDYSKIVVHLVAAIQDLKADNDAMKERIALLEAK